MSTTWPSIAGTVRPYYAGAKTTVHSVARRVEEEPVLAEEAPQPAAVEPKDVVRSAVATRDWLITERVDHWEVLVPLASERSQTVVVRFDRQDKDGHDIIAYSSPCGPARKKHAMAFLRYNTRMVHAAFAVDEDADGEIIVVQANQLAETADPLEVVQLIATVARQADNVEKRLTGEDQY